jgi:hypothetical protein
VNVARLELPTHNRVAEVGVVWIPRVHQQARRIDFEIFAFHAKLSAVVADAFG